MARADRVIEAALAREREGQLVLLKSKDALEGIMAWAQKRPPNFSGVQARYRFDAASNR